MATMCVRGVDYEVVLLDDGQLSVQLGDRLIVAGDWNALRTKATRAKAPGVHIPFVHAERVSAIGGCDSWRIQRCVARGLHADGRQVLITYEDGSKGVLSRWVSNTELRADTDVEYLASLYHAVQDAQVALNDYVNKQRMNVRDEVSSALAKLQDSEQA